MYLWLYIDVLRRSKTFVNKLSVWLQNTTSFQIVSNLLFIFSRSLLQSIINDSVNQRRNKKNERTKEYRQKIEYSNFITFFLNTSIIMPRRRLQAWPLITISPSYPSPCNSYNCNDVVKQCKGLRNQMRRSCNIRVHNTVPTALCTKAVSHINRMTRSENTTFFLN